jgi:hypothetical protein
MRPRRGSEDTVNPDLKKRGVNVLPGFNYDLIMGFYSNGDESSTLVRERNLFTSFEKIHAATIFR